VRNHWYRAVSISGYFMVHCRFAARFTSSFLARISAERLSIREIVPWLTKTLCVSWSHVIKSACVKDGCSFLCSQRAIWTSLVMFVLVDLFQAIVLWFWLWLQLWLWVAAIPTWTPWLANVTNGASGELFNDPLFINIMSKLIQNPRSWQY